MTVDPEVVQVLEDGYRSFSADGRFGDFADRVDPDLEWVEGGISPEGGNHHGRESFFRYAGSWSESFEEFRIEPIETLVEGDNVVMSLRQSGRGRASGVEFETELVHVWQISGRCAVRWESYRTLELALAALQSPSSD